MDQGARSSIQAKSISIATAWVCSSVKTLELLHHFIITSGAPLFLPRIFLSVFLLDSFFFFSSWPLSKRCRTCPRPQFGVAVRREREGAGGGGRSDSFPPPLLSARHSLISFNSPVSSVAGGSRKAAEEKKKAKASSLMLSLARCCHNGPRYHLSSVPRCPNLAALHRHD